MSDALDLDLKIGNAQRAISKARTLTAFFGSVIDWDKPDLDTTDLAYIDYQHTCIADTVSMIFDYLDQADKALKDDIIEKAIKQLHKAES